MNRKENLNDVYLELLSWLQYEGRPSERIWHPLFYTYPWGLRFELGLFDLDDRLEYVQSAKDRGRRIWDQVFAPDDEVLVIFDATPDAALKQELKGCRLQRLRALASSPFPGRDRETEPPRYFYRHLYRAEAKDVPFDSILKRIVEEQTVTGGLWRYMSSVYFYNRTKKLLFHPYDDRGADLIGPDRESLRPYYRGLNELLLDWNREDMDRKWKTRTVHIRVLTTGVAPKTEKRLRDTLRQMFPDARMTDSGLTAYWKYEGWGELNVTMETAQPLEKIKKRLADRWESDTASEGIRLQDVGFLWVRE